MEQVIELLLMIQNDITDIKARIRNLELDYSDIRSSVNILKSISDKVDIIGTDVDSVSGETKGVSSCLNKVRNVVDDIDISLILNNKKIDMLGKLLKEVIDIDNKAV